MPIFALSSVSPVCKSTFSPVPNASRAPRIRVSASAAAVAAPAAQATMYDLLSVSHTAGASEIRAAYRRVALQWHPDACRCAGDERRYAERFMGAREAYEVLSDPVRRRNYDLALSGDGWGAAVGAAPAFHDGRARRREVGVTALGNWETQLDGLLRRSAVVEAGAEETWGGRVRRVRGA